MRRTFLLFTMSLLLCCNINKKSNDSIEIIAPEKTLSKKVNVNKFENYFVQDTTVEKKGRFNSLSISNFKESDSIVALCTCKKNVKKNIMKIQLKTGIPNKSVLDTLKKENRKGNKILEIGGFDIRKKINGQFKFLTMDYSIASDIYGSFALHLPKEFGYFENDTILKGNFECYNWNISDKENIKNWNIQKWYKDKNASRALYD